MREGHVCVEHGTSDAGAGPNAVTIAAQRESSTSVKAVASKETPSPPTTHRTVRCTTPPPQLAEQTRAASSPNADTSHRGESGHARVPHAALIDGASPMKSP
jgi:hypothetical protein